VGDKLVELDKTKNLATFANMQEAGNENSNFNRLDIPNKSGAQTEKLNEEISQKEKVIQQKDSKIVELENDITNMQAKLDEILYRQIDQQNKHQEENRKKEEEFLKQQEEKRKLAEENLRQQKEQAKRQERIKKTVVSALMILGLLLSLSILIISGFSLLWILVVNSLMAIGIAVYFRVGLWSLMPYGGGLIIVTGLMLDKYNLNNVLWIIPMAWELTMFVLEKVLTKDK
jgi:uncharacterized membrane protein